jgi:hypothetical protein
MTNLRPKGEATLPTQPSLNGRLDEANPWLGVIFNASRKRRIRILILTDSDIGFDERDFGLSELIQKALIPSALPWEDLIIVTAHRAANERADIPGFRFDVTPAPPYDCPFTKEHYEQVWLFGKAGADDLQALSCPELAILAKFMNSGGGVFATGDHTDLGAALCGRVPRVRSMRKWFFTGVPPELQAPGRNDVTRLDTLREGFDHGFSSDDQSDRFPQEIGPAFSKAGECGEREPHPLLAYGRFAITVLPDHMHEGECIIPTNLTETFSFDGAPAAKEYPELTGLTDRLAPEVVAVAISAGGGFIEERDFPPVQPRCFKAIVAYDGPLAGVGRVAVDSSFHHFLNINLKGEAGGDPEKRGFYDKSGNPTKDYLKFKRYYRNLVTWLCPPEVRTAYYLRMLVGLRYLSPLIEEIQPVKEPDWDDVLDTGAVTHNAITERFSCVEATQCALALVDMLPEESRAAVLRLADPRLRATLRGEKQSVFFNAGVLPKAILGSAMLGIAASLPESSSEVHEALTHKETQGATLNSFVATHLKLGLSLMAPAVDDLSSALSTLTFALKPNQ